MYYNDLKKVLMKEDRIDDIKEGKKIIFFENRFIKKIIEYIITNPNLYANPNKTKRLFIKFPELRNVMENNVSFWLEILKYEFSEDLQKKFFENNPSRLDDVKE